MTISDRSIYDYYNITEIIGEGTFSTVTLANNINKEEEKYAVKIISKEILDKERRTYVDWEISILSKCQHPNIIKFIEHFESEEDICLVLEWIPNGDLFDRIINKGVFSEDEALLTMKSLLSAIEYLHDRSIVHRDIKPENILVSSSEGDIKLADFGLAKYYEESVGMDKQCGTLAYSAPEITNNQIYRKSVDMWSCGCILYFILFGRPPFYSNDESIMYELIVKGEWSFPSNSDFKYSNQVKDLIKSLLQQDPNKRLTVKESLGHPWILGEKSFSKLSFRSLLQSNEFNYNIVNNSLIHSNNNDDDNDNNHDNNNSANNSSMDEFSSEEDFTEDDDDYDDEVEEKYQQKQQQHQEQQQISMRTSSSSASKPISIKKSNQLRASFNQTVDILRGPLTPL
ncbi:hypothetical protein DICPUDRAFT_59197 [Dictyostelium purpureum]|uniref:non-specific serine/threonine protein kinase n=1 Tax=Dictyostelium purpureum TaxID=5786 RepID=F1A4U7_DICPU|nr:uncharacterized protein DICPUDRAFT_59197 [Dictyostelium purpureum]EGC28785.1 hypothetical protein DICPUDRAFT_59197 [Dictyostelium purpureum]|eukprot:XP_003294691.1 hypothetical protein DICPUDRAFT_59197 [Dictyostelium purpureum]